MVPILSSDQYVIVAVIAICLLLMIVIGMIILGNMLSLRNKKGKSRQEKF